MEARKTIFTDAASLCVYDPAQLEHRINDDADWWTYPPSELAKEMNIGNVLVVDIGSDGVYDLHVHDGPVKYLQRAVSAKLACPSGKLFAGKGEAIPDGGFGPDEEYDGVFVSVPPGTYIVTVAEGEPWASEYEISLELTDEPAENSFGEQPRLLAEERQFSLEDIMKVIARVKSEAESAVGQSDASPNAAWAREKLQVLEREFARGEPGEKVRKEYSDEVRHAVKKDRAFRDSDLGQGLLLLSSAIWRPWVQDYPA